MFIPWLSPLLLPIAQKYPSTRPAFANIAIMGFLASWIAGAILSPAFIVWLAWRRHFTALAGFAAFIAYPYIAKPKVWLCKYCTPIFANATSTASKFGV
jgi:hypothetical protein